MNFDCNFNFTYFYKLIMALKFIVGSCENAVCNDICTSMISTYAHLQVRYMWSRNLNQVKVLG